MWKGAVLKKDRKIPVTRSSMSPMEEYMAEIAPLWDSHWLTNMGIKHQALESELRDYLGVPNVSLFVNGHSALECILEAMDLHGEVVTTPFSFASTTHAIVRKGLKPVFADIKADDYTLDPDSIERAITPRTCAIMPVHVYGNLCDVEAIQEIADRNNIKVIYDAAHAFGVFRGEESSAAFGDASVFSFHATKVFNTIEGGAVCFKDSKLYSELNQWKNFGILGSERVKHVGGNAKMNEFCAAMGICNLRHLKEEISKRKIIAERYWENLNNVPGIVFCKPEASLKCNYAYLPVLFEDTFGETRDEVFDALAAEGINARKYFYPLISDYECYKDLYDSAQTPVAKYVAQHIMTLPIYADLAIEDVDRICSVVEGAVNAR